MSEIRLTALVTGGGCACKLRAGELMQVLEKIEPFRHAWVDTSVGAFEDAAVLHPPGQGSLVFTVDFFTPIVDDPESFGAIAAANALSDVYAMGGEPQAALAVCGFPSDLLPLEVLERIFRAGRDKAAEAGCAIVGGHTVRDPELKYGLCVIGSVDRQKMLTHTAARVGDVLVLTKPLGFGIASQAIKRGQITEEQLSRVVALMTTLNKGAKDAALAVGARAATDVTGFGLLGHLRNMLVGSGVAARIDCGELPVLDFVRSLAESGLIPGGSKNNLTDVSPYCAWGDDVSEIDRILLADAQTSGGLLIAVAAERAVDLVAELVKQGTPAAATVGEVVQGEPGTMRIV